MPTATVPTTPIPCQGGQRCDPSRCPSSTTCTAPDRRAGPGLIPQVFLVLSGKGGVGKSTVAVQLARGLAGRGIMTGLLDADVHGPSQPRLCGMAGARHGVDGSGRLTPMRLGPHLQAVSLGWLLESADQPVIWRGPAKTGAIRQLVEETAWEDLACMVVDLPPGTGDEALTAVQMIHGRQTAALIVTTPQTVAVDDVRRSIAFCRQVAVPILGLVENFAGFRCPCCGTVSDPFARGGADTLTTETGLPLLARLPLDPGIGRAADAGNDPALVSADSPCLAGFAAIITAALAHLPSTSSGASP